MIWNGKYVSINNIITKVYRDMGMSDQINYTDAVEWIGEAIELIGNPGTHHEIVDIIEVSEYRARLPLCLHQIQSAWGYDGVVDAGCLNDTTGFIPMRYSTDVMHHYTTSCKDRECQSRLTYKVNNDFMFANFESGAIKLSYWAIASDENGFPLIPDQIKFREAVAGHLKWKIAFIKWMGGKMPGAVYQKIEQDRDWYIGAAQTAGQMPGLDMMEGIKNNFLRLIPKINQHMDGFQSAGDAEQRITHNSLGSSGTDGSADDRPSSTFFFFRDADGNSQQAGE